MRRRGTLGAVAVIAVVVGYALGGATWPAVDAQGVCTTPTAGGGLVFEGEGDDVTEPFDLAAGTVVISAHAEGVERFIVFAHLAPGGGAGPGPPVVLVTGDGPYDGRSAARVAQRARYILEIDHDGPWRIEIEQ
jgi:hypothetical protein